MSGSIIPTLRYRDAPAAVDWLTRAFGFERHQVMEGPDGTIAHAELTLGTGMVMLGSVKDVADSPYQGIAPPPGSSSAYVVVQDPDAHHARAVAAGAEVVMGLTDQDYGSREYTARDPEGNVWSFGTYDPWQTG